MSRALWSVCSTSRTKRSNSLRGSTGSTVAVSTGLSVGYVLWLVRGGVLLSSVLSSMPAWQQFLSEEEIWKVILFLYDYTGYEPRSWGEE